MSLWTNWMDYTPVVGTVKNTVEIVSALCQGDYDQARQIGASAAIALLLDVSAGLLEAKAGAGGMVEAKGSKGKSGKPAGKPSKPSGSGSATTPAIVSLEDLIKKSKARDPDIETEEAVLKKPANRGEHVINNNVLKVFKTIIDRYASRIGKSAAELLHPNTMAYDAYNSPLPEDTTKAIRYEMVVHLPENSWYIDANSTLYGKAIQQISDLVVDYMYAYKTKTGWVAPAVHRNIVTLVTLLNDNQLYVDEFAKQKWITEGGDEAQFERYREQVAAMFRRLCSSTASESEALHWVHDLK